MDAQDIVFTSFENQETARKLLITDEPISIGHVKVEEVGVKHPPPNWMRLGSAIMQKDFETIRSGPPHTRLLDDAENDLLDSEDES